METLAFHYHLNISFSEAIHDHSFTLRCFPHTDDRQRIEDLQASVFPNEYFTHGDDNFGNLSVLGFAGQPHAHFTADVTGVAHTGLAECVPEENAWREHLFWQQTPLTRPDEELSAFAASIPTYASELATAQAVMEAVAQTIAYVPGVTTVDTTAKEAFALKQGVCQDYSHIMLSVLRQKKIMARYVVGMLVGEGASHAWVEIKDGTSWYGFDPTNNIRVEDQHIKISHGRDYRDCRINQGHFYGYGKQTTDISVTVQRKEDAPA